MYLLRRKSDGKYFRNLSFRSAKSYRKNQDHNWTDNPGDCKPFRNKMGAWLSRGVNNGVYTDMSIDEWHMWSRKQKDEYLKYRKQELFEVVPVSVSIQVSSL